MHRRSDEIVAKVLAMDDTQLNSYLSSLSGDSLEYLELLLTKVENQPARFKQYLDLS